MKQFLCGILALACLAGLTACGGKEETPASAANEGTAQEQSHIYTTQVQYTGEDDPVQYLEIAARSAHLLAELEDKAGAFVADFYNYQAMDDASTPLYTMNGMQFAEEIDPNGRCIRVSRNYFVHNPIETADGSDLTGQFVYDDLTLNLLVPEKYRDMEDDIVEAHRDRFYFEKVEAENAYNQEAGISERMNIAKEDLKINIIYVKDGQNYFSFRSDCAQQTGCKVGPRCADLHRQYPLQLCPQLYESVGLYSLGGGECKGGLSRNLGHDSLLRGGGKRTETKGSCYGKFIGERDTANETIIFIGR